MLAIDPGASGAIVYDSPDGVQVVNMPDGIDDLLEAIRDARFAGSDTTQSLYCFVEKVGTYMPGNSGPAAATFARHCGRVEMAVHACGLAQIQITPAVWMKSLGALPSDKSARKKRIKELMAMRFPDIKVTLKNADALGIYCYGKEYLAARKEAV